MKKITFDLTQKKDKKVNQYKFLKLIVLDYIVSQICLVTLNDDLYLNIDLFKNLFMIGETQ